MPILLAAQLTQATLVGTVRDGESGQPLAGAYVALTELDRGASTDSAGYYSLAQVPPGPHHVSVRLIGYARTNLHALVPREGTVEINVSLRPEPLRLQPLEIQAPVAIRGVDRDDKTSLLDREISEASIRNHPLLGEPDAFEALGGGEVVLRPESPSGIHIRGSASDQTAYLLDGIPVFSPYHAAGVASAWNPDALSRLHVTSPVLSLAYTQTLAGSILGVTRVPGPQLRSAGSLSTTQARIAFDGPIGSSGAGYVASLRGGLPNVLAPNTETDYLRGDTGDALGKLEAPLLGGWTRLLGFFAENDINAAATIDPIPPGQTQPRNVYEWENYSLGAEWRYAFSKTTVRVVGWSARADAHSIWAGQASGIEMTSRRRDGGVLAAAELGSGRVGTTLGVRAEWSTTSYSIVPDSAGGPTFRLDGKTPLTAAFARHARGIGDRIEMILGVSLATTDGNLRPAPVAQLRWSASDRLTMSGSYARTNQYAQSLRNAESVVGTVFPADLYIGSGAPGVPVARSDQGVLAAEYHPAAGVRLGMQAYARGSDGLVLVAPRDGEPFTTGAFVVGSGTSRGISAEAAVSTTRYAIIASYGLERVRLQYGDSSYVPENAATHRLEGGVTYFPLATLSIRLGATTAFGRRTTTAIGNIEWEACNLLDQGCEFGGSPHYGGQPLGATKLPPYVRVDIGVRKHWHIGVGGRDAQIGLFGSLTNLLGRKNVLTYSENPSTGEIKAIDMRPRAPLVVGLDWRF